MNEQEREDYREAIQLFVDGIIEDIKNGAFTGKEALFERVWKDVREERHVVNRQVGQNTFWTDAFVEIIKRPEYLAMKDTVPTRPTSAGQEREELTGRLRDVAGLHEAASAVIRQLACFLSLEDLKEAVEQLEQQGVLQ